LFYFVIWIIEAILILFSLWLKNFNEIWIIEYVIKAIWIITILIFYDAYNIKNKIKSFKKECEDNDLDL